MRVGTSSMKSTAARICDCLRKYGTLRRQDIELRLELKADGSKHALARLKKAGYVRQDAPGRPYSLVPGTAYVDRRGQGQFGKRNPASVEDVETFLSHRLAKLRAEAPRTVPPLDGPSLIASQLVRA